MASWTGQAFKAALATAVGARSGITSLSPAPSVTSFWLPPEVSFSADMVMFYKAEGDHEPAAVGQGRYEDRVTVSCEIRVIRPITSTAPADVETRIDAIIGQIDLELRGGPPTVGSQTIDAYINSVSTDIFPDEADHSPVWIGVCELTVFYRARTANA